jgi:DNA polymerase-1
VAVQSVKRPLLVIDGDSFAHRAYHALPKTIRRRGNRGGGAIVGFANSLLRPSPAYDATGTIRHT